MGKFDWQEDDTVGITVVNPMSTAELDEAIDRVNALIRDAEFEALLVSRGQDKED